MPILKDGKQPRLYSNKYPSVTEVLSVIPKPHLDSWRKRVGHKAADEISDKATSLGTRVHSLARAASLGMEIKETDPQLVSMTHAYEEFLEEYVDEVLDTERQVVSDTLGVGGTLDAYVRLKSGEHAIIDIKTSRSFSPDMGLQLGAYMSMMQELGLPVDKRIVVRLRKDKPGKWHVKFYEEHDRDITAFRAAVALWTWVHRWYPDTSASTDPE